MMGALIRALTNNAVENIEEALGMTDATSSAMKHAIAECMLHGMAVPRPKPKTPASACRMPL